jgi:hypothetical protein
MPEVNIDSLPLREKKESHVHRRNENQIAKAQKQISSQETVGVFTPEQSE